MQIGIRVALLPFCQLPIAKAASRASKIYNTEGRCLLDGLIVHLRMSFKFAFVYQRDGVYRDEQVFKEKTYFRDQYGAATA